MAGRSADSAWHAFTATTTRPDAPEAGAAPVVGADGGTAAQQQRAAGEAAAELQQSTPPAGHAEQQAGPNDGRSSFWPSSQSWNEESGQSRSGRSSDSSDWYHKESYGYSAKRGKDDDAPTWDGKTLPLKDLFSQD